MAYEVVEVKRCPCNLTEVVEKVAKMPRDTLKQRMERVHALTREVNLMRERKHGVQSRRSRGREDSGG